MKVIKRIYLCILCFVLLFVAGLPAQAESQPSFGILVNRDDDNMIATIEISLTNPQADVPVVIKVVDSNDANLINYMGQKFTVSDGKAVFIYKNVATEGYYTINAYLPDTGERLTKQFLSIKTVTRDKLVNDIITIIKAPNVNVNDVKIAMLTYVDHLNIDLGLYNKLMSFDAINGTSYNMTAFQYMINMSANSELNSVTSLLKLYYSSVLLTAVGITDYHSSLNYFNTDIHSVDFYKHIVMFDKILPLSSDVNKDYLDVMEQSAKDALLETVLSKSYHNIAEFQEALSLNALTKSIWKASHYNRVKDVLAEYKKLGKLTLASDAFGSLNNKEAVYSNMAGQVYRSFTEVDTAFALFATRQKQAEDNSKPGNTSKPISVSSVTVVQKPLDPNLLEVLNKQEEGSNELNKGNPLYRDMQDAKWAIEAANALTQAGFINGKAEGIFDPYSNITRAEIIKILTLILKSPDTAVQPPFIDIGESDWYYSYAAKAYSSGLVLGADGRFNPIQVITREEMAVLMDRIMKQLGANLKQTAASPFNDKDEIASWAYPSVEKMLGGGIMKGKTGYVFQPKGVLTRAEGIKIIYDTLMATNQLNIK
jgi:hypothetical protein